MGYHINKIPKGKLGEFSKIEEEFEELKDSVQQNVSILTICELCDMVGAIELFASNKFNLSLDDLVKMKDLTRRAFESGDRK